MSVLSVDALAVSYGPVAALCGVDLKVDEGQTVAVLGANGAGKSTLLRTISGLVQPVSGTVSFEGVAIQRVPAPRIAAMRLGHVPEGRDVFAEMTVEENLLVGAYRLRRGRSRIKPLLAEVYDIFPRLAERRRQDASSLSGGEQQMLALGRAMMGEPKLLMLDEPSLGLAPIVVGRVFEAIREMQARGMTILLVEQNASLALRHSSYAYVLSLGRIVVEGTGEALLEDLSVQRAYLGAPAEESDRTIGDGRPVGRSPVRRFREER
jgi:branched-chain amino acid transport system ATP-binding protein